MFHRPLTLFQWPVPAVGRSGTRVRPGEREGRPASRNAPLARAGSGQGTAEANLRLPEGKQRHIGRANEVLAQLDQEEGGHPWNLLALRTPLRNWSRPAPA